MILPLLCTLMFGTLQMGMMIFSYNTMLNAAESTVRSMAFCTVKDVPTARTQITRDLPKWVNPADFTVTPDFTTYAPNQVAVTVSVPASQAGLVPWVPFGTTPISVFTIRNKEIDPQVTTAGGVPCS